MINSRNLNSLNPHIYEQYLSSFGKKVLGNLLKNLGERDKRRKNQCAVKDRYQGHNKKVLTFGNSHCSNFSASIGDDNVLSNEFQNSNYYNDLSNKQLKTSDGGISQFFRHRNGMPVIPTSNGLLRTVNDNVMTELSDAILQSKEIEKFDDQPVDKQIEWDDIFDTQLLEDLNILDIDSNSHANKEINKIDNPAIADPENEFEIPKVVDIIKSVKPAECEKNTNTDDILKMLDILPVEEISEKRSEFVRVPPEKIYESAINTVPEIPKIFKITNKVKPKRRNLTKITDTISKKVKKLQTGEPIGTLRKQRYTKAVKTWLNDVDPENFEDVIESTKTFNPENAKAMLQKTSNEVINSACKKTVQSQLTNKGGVMKFEKPKKIAEVVETQKAIDTKLKNNGDADSKEKKVKAKFIAPIKSPIPVTDISYTIYNITPDNYKDFENVLNSIREEEIFVALIFNNGFCQLNCHYTEDTCVVEGAMFHYGGVFYYWKDCKEFWVTMQTIIKHNIIICYEGKNLLKYLASQHEMDLYTANVKILDTQIGGSLIDPDNPPENFTQLQKLVNFVPEYTIATECVLQKSAWYLTMLAECFAKLRGVLVEAELWKLFLDIEMRVLPIIAGMEQRGVCVNIQRLKAMETTLLTRMKVIEQACHLAAGRTFQVTSASQVRSILYDELKLDTKCNIKIRETLSKGEKSTSETMLRSLMSVHPLPKLILEYRHLHKAHATFLSGIGNQVKDGVVKPTWVQTAAATGRIASNNPNLQAIPKAPFTLVLFPASDGEDLVDNGQATLKFRSVYIAREGHAMLAADFKHVECRVFAHAAADTSLLEALNSPDLFRVLAARWLNKSEQDVSSEDRERTKRIIYASLYGAGTRKLMDILDVSYDQALSIISSFNRTFPSLKSFGRAVVSRCELRGGSLRTPSGRARTFRNIASADFSLKSHAERQAVNFIVQGSAADLCKMAMVVATERMRAADPPLRAHLLLQIHDELVWEVDHRDLDRAAVIIKAAMEGIGHACGMAMTLPVALSAGPSWGEMEDLNIDSISTFK